MLNIKNKKFCNNLVQGWSNVYLKSPLKIATNQKKMNAYHQVPTYKKQELEMNIKKVT